MKRTALAVVVTACFGLLSAPVRADDTILRRDPITAGKNLNVRGTIQDEMPAGVKIKVGKDSQTIPPEDILYVGYDTTALPDVDPLALGNLHGQEVEAMAEPADQQKAELADVTAGYAKLEKQLKTAPNALRYVHYRQAMLIVRQTKPDASKASAIDALKGYLAANPGGWEVVPATKTLAQMMLDSGDKKGALDAYNDLTDAARHPDMPKDVQLNMNLLVAKMLLADKNYKDAAAKLNAVLGATTDEKQKAMLQVYLQQTQVAQGNLTGVDAKLKDVIKASTDDNLRAAAYNTLGDYYQQAKQPDEAFWLYLRVDVLYGQDREEHARALYNLWKLFDSVRGDAQRSKECLEHLKDPSLAGTEYQARALKETEGGAKTP